MSAIYNDNLSEDIFQDFDSDGSKLRRSQRILKKNLNTFDTEDVIPPNQTNVETTAVQECRETPTPDFTHYFTAIPSNSNVPLELSLGNLVQKEGEMLLKQTFEVPLDLSRNQTKNIDFITSTPISFKNDMIIDDLNEHVTEEGPGIASEAMQTELTQENDSNLRLAQRKTLTPISNLNTEINKNDEIQKPENTKTTDEKIHLQQAQGIVLAAEETKIITQTEVSSLNKMLHNTDGKNKNVEEPKKTDDIVVIGQTQVIAPKVRQTKRKSQTKVKNELPKSVSESAPPKYQRKQQRVESKQTTQLEKLPIKCVSVGRRGRPRQSQSKTDVSAVKKSSVADYVPPKVLRYYNSCPLVSPFPSEHCKSIHQSLLPPVYPPHFKNQILGLPQPTPPLLSIAPPRIFQPENINLLDQHASVPINIPTTFLTPENSEIISVENSNENEMCNTPPTAELTSSQNSLRNFFEIDEIKDIFDMERTVFQLSELHVRALAVVLNMNRDELFDKFAFIAKSDNESLQQLLTAEEKNFIAEMQEMDNGRSSNISKNQ